MQIAQTLRVTLDVPVPVTTTRHMVDVYGRDAMTAAPAESSNPPPMAILVAGQAVS